jgi:hypothetical protein
MRPVFIALLTLLAGCEPVEPRGGSMPPREPPPKPDPVEAVEVSAPSVAEATPAEPAEPAEPAPPEQPAEPAAAEMTDEELLAVAMGLPLPPKKADAPLPVAPSGEAVAPWTPSAPAPTWGVRVVSIVADAQPPRAILGLGDGREIVVEPGTFVPEERVIVMAIGAEAVQIAHVEPAGDRSRIETQVLTPLYRPQPQR